MINSKIIKIANNTKYFGLKNKFTHKSLVKNSLCGDKIKIELIASKTKINSMRYETESCILCEASASLIAKKIINYSLNDLSKDIKNLKEIIKDNKTTFPVKFKEFKHLLKKKDMNRVNCVILPLNAVIKALKFN
mgnify:CR=1 FL=1